MALLTKKPSHRDSVFRLVGGASSNSGSRFWASGVIQSANASIRTADRLALVLVPRPFRRPRRTNKFREGHRLTLLRTIRPDVRRLGLVPRSGGRLGLP